MKNTNVNIDLTSKYKKRFLALFQEFLNKGIDNSIFLAKLYSFEMKIRNEHYGNSSVDCGLWFRFFNGDTGATTISNIENYFKGSMNNYNYFIECLNLAIESNELHVYFS